MGKEDYYNRACLAHKGSGTRTLAELPALGSGLDEVIRYMLVV